MCHPDGAYCSQKQVFLHTANRPSESTDFIDVTIKNLRGVFPYRPDGNPKCPLYPRKRTWFSTIAMSALCQKQTLARLLRVTSYPVRLAPSRIFSEF